MGIIRLLLVLSVGSAQGCLMFACEGWWSTEQQLTDQVFLQTEVKQYRNWVTPQFVIIGPETFLWIHKTHIAQNLSAYTFTQESGVRVPRHAQLNCLHSLLSLNFTCCFVTHKKLLDNLTLMITHYSIITTRTNAPAQLSLCAILELKCWPHVTLSWWGRAAPTTDAHCCLIKITGGNWPQLVWWVWTFPNLTCAKTSGHAKTFIKCL